MKQVITGGNTTLYVNMYFENNLTTGNATTYYYHGGRLVAMKQGSANVTYVHQDSLGGTSVVSNANGALVSSISYMPFGGTRSGSVSTDIKFTGQRLDGTGLYYYGARYYDPMIGRFISADTYVPWSTGFDVVSNPLTVNTIPRGLGAVLAPEGNYPRETAQAPANPQMLNRYSYVVNSPLRYTDPYGWWTFGFGINWQISGFGWSFSASGMLVTSGKGELGFVWSGGGGGGAGYRRGAFPSTAAGVTGQAQWTSADSMERA